VLGAFGRVAGVAIDTVHEVLGIIRQGTCIILLLQ
jgi:hypothetical protein